MLLILLKLKSEVPLEVAAKMDFQFWEFQIFGCSTWKPLHSTRITILLVCVQAACIMPLNLYLYIIYIWKEIQMQASQEILILKKNHSS